MKCNNGYYDPNELSLYYYSSELTFRQIIWDNFLIRHTFGLSQHITEPSHKPSQHINICFMGTFQAYLAIRDGGEILLEVKQF